MDLSTSYLGLKLRTPLIPSPSPLMHELANLRKMEDAGASAIVLHSVFEEQIVKDIEKIYHDSEAGSDSFAEALTYFPRPGDFPLGPVEYLDHLRNAKQALQIPVIASLNGFSTGGWTDYAREIQQAGADGLELNMYFIPTDPKVSGKFIEESYLEILQTVVSEVRIPVAVKLSPFFSNPVHMAAQFTAGGVGGLVLFNRFYQPDIDLQDMEVKPRIELSDPGSLRLPLRWIAILRGKVKVSLALSGGVHTGQDAVKALLAGADAVMVCSALLKNGIGHIKEIERGMCEWMESRQYDSVELLKGSLSRAKAEHDSAYERALYIRGLTEYEAG